MTIGSFLGGVLRGILILATCIGSFKFGMWLGFKVREPVDPTKSPHYIPPPEPILTQPIHNPPQSMLKKDSENKP